jgi:hypothetical protein
MNERTQRVSDLLHEAGQVHDVVYRITDGADDDWASLYADWLIRSPKLPETLGEGPIGSHLVHELVESERAPDESAWGPRWQDVYAERITSRFG